MQETDRGKSVGYEQAYKEGYSAKYHEWNNRENPYKEGTPEYEGFFDGYAEATSFA
jgi:hypothetical protein